MAWRGRLLAELGLQEMLTTLNPLVSWNGPVLQIEAPEELDLYPGDAGLTLLPSLFWTGRPMLGEHPDGSAVIVYPALAPLPLVEEVTEDPLGELLRRTRAAVLELAVTERTTSELARELHVTTAAVSGHTKTLRAAGLIVTPRAGKAVLHSVTPLGDRLLANVGHLPAHPERRPANQRLTTQEMRVPGTSSTSRDQAIFVDQATDASRSSCAVLVRIFALTRIASNAVVQSGPRSPIMNLI